MPRPFRTLTALLTTLLTAVIAGQLDAATLYVDDNAPGDPGPGDPTVSDPAATGSLDHPYDAIQKAVNASINGGLVLVQSGTYTGTGNRAIDYKGKLITVRGIDGPDSTIVDCQGIAYAFRFVSKETTSAVLDGLTITGAASGAIGCSSQSSPRIINCRIINNTSSSSGGGISCTSSSHPTIADSLIAGNTAGSGGGLVVQNNSNPSIIGCTITRCTSSSSGGGGGGVAVGFGCRPVLTDCLISENSAEAGAGAYCENSSPVFSRCRFANNKSVNTVSGGGLFARDANIALEYCVFQDNGASEYGGALYFTGSGDAMVSNCLLTRNRASRGGAVYTSVDTTVKSCTFSANRAYADGGAAAFTAGSSVVVNTIMWNDTAPSGSEILLSSSTASLAIGSSVVQGGSAAIGGQDGTLDWQTGNITTDPGLAFIDDYHLSAGSPCIDAAISTPPGGLPGTDLDGTIRSQDGDGNGSSLPDIGAYEFNSAKPCIAVSPSQLQLVVQLNSSQPVSAPLSIRNAGGGVLAWALAENADWLSATPASGSSSGEVDQVTLTANATGLAAGAYAATLSVSDSQATMPVREIAIVLRVARTLRVPANYATIQAAIDAATDGDVVLVADGIYTGTGNRDISFLGKKITVRGENGADRTTIDCEQAGRGFVFSNHEGPSSRLQNITIYHGCAKGSGYPEKESYGGAAYFDTKTEPTITDCTFVENTAFLRGGALYISEYASPAFRNCRILNNVARYDHAGAAYLAPNAAASFVNCVIAGNTARSHTGAGGGAVFCCDGSHTRITNCTIVGNAGEYMNGGGGLYLSGGTMAITNSIVWGNMGQPGPQIKVGDYDVNLTVQYSDVQGGRESIGGVLETATWGPGNIDVNPRFAFADDFHLLNGSPCIDAGTNTGSDLPAEDIDGKDRSLDGDGDGAGVADMGAHERSRTLASVALSPPQMEFVAPQGMPTPASQPLDIRNADFGTLRWQAVSTGPWLSISPGTGTSTTEINTVTVSVDASGLALGSHRLALIIANLDDAGDSRVVPVTLHVVRTLRVPSEYPTIQAAVDAATDRDVVFVADGEYTGPGNETVDFCGKPITVRSENGPLTTVVRVGNVSWGFQFVSGETATSILEGFTITGRSYHLIHCDNGSPAIRNCRVIGAEGGEYDKCAVFLSDSYSILSDCLVSDNASTGIYSLGGGRPVITRCDIQRNGRGGVFLYNRGDALISNCRITDNWGAGSGGGVCIGYDRTATIENCLIARNQAGSGGGISINVGRVSNCTVVDNYAATKGGGIACSIADVVNCLLWGNAAPEGQGPELSAGSNGHVRLWFNDIQGARAGVREETMGSIEWGEGNQSIDPQFAFPDDYHLMSGSDCVDAGGLLPSQTLWDLPSTDLDGTPRILDGNADGTATIDIGAYEQPPDTPVIALTPERFDFVLPAGTTSRFDQLLEIRGTGQATLHWSIATCPWLIADPPAGTSDGEVDNAAIRVDARGLPWGQYTCQMLVSGEQVLSGPRLVDVTVYATKVLRVPSEHGTIQAAIDAATRGDVVLVADGTYSGTGNHTLDFKGKQITVRSEHGPEFSTIDAGSLGRGFYFHNKEGPASTLSGFKITGGSAYSGSGITLSSSRPTIRDCVLTNNTATGVGGGIACWSGSAPLISNCRINANQADDGGGVYCEDSDPVVVNCVISGNTAKYSGGGVLCYAGSHPRIVNCVITGNRAMWGTGLACDTYYVSDSSGLTLGPIGLLAAANCIIRNGGNEIRILQPEYPATVSYSDVQGGWSGTGNISADPLFVRAGYWDTAGTPEAGDDRWIDGDYRLTTGSPCIDAADNQSVPADSSDVDDDGDVTEPFPFDFNRTVRFLDEPSRSDTGNGTAPIVDMGAYEYIPDCNANGVPDVQEPDEDGDGVIDDCDDCPHDPEKTEPGACGCGAADVDEDGNGVPDCLQPAVQTNTNEVIVLEGGTASFEVKLNARPGADVTVSVVITEGGDPDLTISSPSPPVLTFTPSNWSVYHAVTLAAAADSDAVGGHATIRCSVPGLANVDVTVIEQDDDTLAIATDNASVSVPEGGSASFRVRLTAQPQADMVVELSKVAGGDSDITIGDPAPATLTYTPSNWDAYQTVTLSAAEDADWVGGQATIQCSALGLAIREVSIIEQDNDIPSIITDTPSITVAEGGTAAFQVKLNMQPSGNVTVNVSRLADADPDITISSPAAGSLTFTPDNWDVLQTVTLAAAEDVNVVNGSATIRCSIPGLATVDVVAVEADNDVLSVRTDTSFVIVPEGNTASFRVRLGAQPTGSLTVTVGKVAGGDRDISATPASLTFTTSNWSVYQTVALSAAEDADTANGEATVRCSAPDLPDTDVAVTEQDNDVLSIVTDKTSISIPEGSTASFQVKLSAEPSSDVTVSISRQAGGDADISVGTANLTFTAANWSVNQTVTVSAASDADYVDGQAIIRCSAAGLADKDLTATEADQGPPATAWYRDLDSDGYGNPDEPVQSSSQPVGYVSDKTDCNDGVADIHPGAADTPDDGIDQDCSGSDATTGPPPPADADGDGVPDASDACPATPAASAVDAQGCAASERDTDSDGVEDDKDQCADTPVSTVVDANGCPSAPADSDGDGVADDHDDCPATPSGVDTDARGCAPSQRDVDEDGVTDDVDQCPGTAVGAVPDAQGCAASQRDSDGDGVPDDADQCPDTPQATSVEANGCPPAGQDGGEPRPRPFSFCGIGFAESMLALLAGLALLRSRRRQW